jgi:alginate O-acetyltransferase complex protein AlgJ
MQTSLPLDAIGPSREGGPTDTAHDARLRRGIIDTSISRPVAIGLTACFLAIIYAVPIGQAIADKLAGDAPVVLELFRRVPTRDNLRQFEKDIEGASFVKDFVQPRLQLVLSRFGRVGNKRAVIGREGWLYYAPGLVHVAGPSFVDDDVIRGREREVDDGGGAPGHADPRPAILAFHEMLRERGITLVLFPVPDKAAIQPVELHGRADRHLAMPVARNVGWNAFVDELRAKGVALFDAAPPLLSPEDPPRFLEQDTHWTPAFMDHVAHDLARFVERVGSLPAVARPSLHEASEEVTRVGDLVDMLKLPEKQSAFLPRQVTIGKVVDDSGAEWESDPAADVLLLGDSFTNVFSMEPMGWGTAAGLAPHLALALGRPVDVIAQNDSGAFATRQALQRDLTQGQDRLAGKKVLIWEFASRELSVGDWRPIDWGRVSDASAREGER